MNDFWMLGVAATFAGLIRLLVALCDRLIGGEGMNGDELVGLVLSLALLAYLTVALLKPEWFS